jgi:hypothetical protein
MEEVGVGPTNDVNDDEVKHRHPFSSTSFADQSYRGGLPPTIAIAMYQAEDVARTYSTLGYLVAIISILGFCIMPRAKFIQTMVIDVLSTCIGAGLCTLMVWSGVQARINTSPAGPADQSYNSSQSVVCGVWLFFQIWLINTLKSKFPQLAFPTIICSVFVIVAAGYGPQFTSTAQATAFIRRLLETFLTGFALATVVSLFIYPATCRRVVTKQMEGYVSTLRETLQAHLKYLHSLETTDVFSKWRTMTMRDNDKVPKKGMKPEIEALKGLDAKLDQMHGKLHGDLPFSKREIAYGKITADGLEALSKHLRDIMVPLKGLSSLADLFERTAEKMQWDIEASSGLDEQEAEALHQTAVEDWQDIMQCIHDPISAIIQAMDGGLAHAMIRLQLNTSEKIDRRKTKSDEEAKGNLMNPGDERFADYLEKQSDEFNERKESILRQWIGMKGARIDDNFTLNTDVESLPGLEALRREPTVIQQRNQRQLYLLLYMLFLLHSISGAVLRLVRFADKRDLANKQSKFLFPGRKRFKKWAQDANAEDEATFESENTIVCLGEAYKKKKDPEHLPPENAWERFGDCIRAIARFFRSSHTSFGFRVACATTTIAIVGFLRDTQKFFIDQRFVWALIMVSISMTPTAGQSVWAFVLRTLGTAIAMIISWLIWYIPGKKTAGILALLWLFLSLGCYIPLKRPDLVIIGLIGLITTTLIVGYQLQVRVLGIELAESNGQPAYPIYLFGPYRLATVIGGLAVAFIWTFFPFPISEHSAVRQKLGAALYLSANYYSVTHETVMGRIRGDEGDPFDKTSPGYLLLKARHRVFAKQMLLIQGLKIHSSFVRWEFPIGGKFPKKQYDSIIQLVSK